MQPSTREQLSAAPRLIREDGHATSPACKVCNHPTAFFDVVDFNKCTAGYPFGPRGVPVPWYRCRACEFLFTPFFDDWCHEEFSEFIYNEDYALVDPDYASRRPLETAALVARRLIGSDALRILDYGSGSGQFAANLAAAGYPDVSTYDPFSQPIRPEGRFDLVTCFEVLEHSPTPLAIIGDILTFTGDSCCVILGQALHPPDIDRIRANWWYCVPRNGHCSTFSDTTLAVLAAECGLTFHRSTNPHTLSRGKGVAATELAKRFGPPFRSVQVSAPAAGATPEWHEMERVAGLQGRWSKRSEVDWRINLPNDDPCTLQVRIPLIMDVRPGFAEASQVIINGVVAKPAIRSRTIVAEANDVTGTTVTITLRTPDPQKASGSDSRQIGLMIEAPPQPSTHGVRS